ncbi:MAG: adaptor protein MecA [Lachnospiraceae bacterium]|nr:adaptor protein MecA [Lachnospiraceae bacterium]MBP5254314.1 adaptor protein MecA [Lachnospiraceae bacterium]
MVTAQDLAARKIAFGELRYGNAKTSELFREILALAVNEYGFNEEELPLMIEAVPLGKDSLMLIFSAVEDAEELDPHYAKFSDSVDTASRIRVAPESRFADPENEPEVDACVVNLPDIDAVMDYSKRVRMFKGRSLLYRDPSGSGFCLVLKKPEEMASRDFVVFTNSVAEFGSIAPGSALLYAALREHEKPVLLDPVRRFGQL